jgi:hypothetical protein
VIEKSPLSAEYCLERAAECEKMAEQTATAANRAILLDSAKRWRALATETEEPSFRRVGHAHPRPNKSET